MRVIGRYVERVARAIGLQIEIVPKGDLIQCFLSGDPHPDHPLAKIEFILDTPPYFAHPRSFDGILVDDFLCIAVNKVTIHTRFDPKDYIDLYLIIRSGAYRPDDLIRLAKQKEVGLDEWTIAGKFRQVTQLPNLSEFQKKYMLAPVEPDDLVRFYQEWADRLSALFPPRRQE